MPDISASSKGETFFFFFLNELYPAQLKLSFPNAGCKIFIS